MLVKVDLFDIDVGTLNKILSCRIAIVLHDGSIEARGQPAHYELNHLG